MKIRRLVLFLCPPFSLPERWDARKTARVKAKGQMDMGVSVESGR